MSVVNELGKVYQSTEKGGYRLITIRGVFHAGFLLILSLSSLAWADTNTPTLIEDARVAAREFKAPTQPTSAIYSVVAPDVDVIAPYDAERQQHYYHDIKAAIEQVLSTQKLDQAVLAKYMAALAPYLRYLEAAERLRGAKQVVVPAKSKTTLQMEAFCLDPNAQAPRRDDWLRLVPLSNYLPDTAGAVYRDLIAYSADHPESRQTIQAVVWDLREAAEGRQYQHGLSDYQRQMLNEAIEGGDAAYQVVLGQLRRDRALAGEAAQPPPLTTNREAVPGFEYTRLAPGVAARAIDATGRASRVEVSIANTGDTPFVFRPTEYAAESSVHAQRQGLGAVLSEGIGNSLAPFREAAEELLETSFLVIDGKSVDGALDLLIDYRELARNPKVKRALAASPAIGQGMAAYEATTGRDIFTGETLSPWDRALALASIVPGEKLLANVGEEALGIYKGIKGQGKGAEPVIDVAIETVGGLRTAGKKDAHHIIQDAAVRNLPGYNTNTAPGIQLPGPSNVTGTPHNIATGVQRQAGGGTYAAERRIGYKAMRRAGVPEGDARAAIQQVDGYFGSIGIGPDTITRIPGNR